MADGGYLVPPPKDEKPSEIWEETWQRVDRFLPNLFQEVFPQPRDPPSSEKKEPQAEQKEPISSEQDDPSVKPVEDEKVQHEA